jgi:ArsR family transcriptional regulator
MPTQPTEDEITRFADMFSAMGAGPRLRIMRVLLSAHPDGMVVSDIGSELGIPASTLSHHLDKLKNEDLVKVRREGTFLWYSANADALQELLGFLYAECCTRNKAIAPKTIVTLCR